MKKLPTFTLRECGKEGACSEAVRFYGRIFGMDMPITVVDIINCNPRRIGHLFQITPAVFSDIAWVSTKWYGEYIGMNLGGLKSRQLKYLMEVFGDYLPTERELAKIALADLFTIFLIQNGYDVSARKEI